MKKILLLACIFLPLFLNAQVLQKAQAQNQNANLSLESFRVKKSSKIATYSAKINDLTTQIQMLEKELQELEQIDSKGELAEKSLALKNEDFNQFRASAFELSKKLNELGIAVNSPLAPTKEFFAEFKNLIEKSDNEILSASLLDSLVLSPSVSDVKNTLKEEKLCKVKIDASLGKLRDSVENKTLLQTIKAGGLCMYPILTFGILSIVVALVKAFELLNKKKLNKDIADSIFKALKEKDFTLANEKMKFLPTSAYKKILDSAISGKDESQEILEKKLDYIAVLETENFSRWNGFLTLSVSICPLLGLLGTVSGIIKTFASLAIYGTGNPQMMSDGIAEALITTKFGLIVAIPAYLFASFFNRKAKAFETQISAFSDTLISTLKGK